MAVLFRPPFAMSDTPDFQSFELADELLQAVAARGYQTPTPVQAESIPVLLKGQDVTVQSRTGTGKTAAFALPILQGIDLDQNRVQCLVLCPTRELALQVHEEFAALGKLRGVKGFPIYGGANMRKQINALAAGLHVVVGTPGRVLDHLRSRRLHLDRVRYLVLDEADEMLSMGFLEEVTKIIERVPSDRQTMLFSATLPPGVEGLIYRYQKEPLRIALSSDNVLVEDVHHAFYITPSMAKANNLARVLLHEEPTNAIIFVNTRDEARVVTGYLKHEGFEVEMLSGEISQREREKVMAAIKRHELRYMVATDVAARGIDISNLSHVINYAVPDNRDVYVHRTGRTGRIGRSGTAITLVGFRDLPKWGEVEAMKGLEPEERKLPTDEEIFEKQVDRVIYAVRHLGRPPGDDPDDDSAEAPPAATPERKFVVAAERLLEQGIESEELARLLSTALTPPEPAEPDPAPRPEAADDEGDERDERPRRKKRRRRRRRPS